MIFELEIERVRRRYRAKVIAAPVGRRAVSWFDLPSEEELEGVRRDLARHRSASRHLHVAHDGKERISTEDFGRRLFESVFAGRVQDAWRTSLAAARGGLLLKLRLDNDPRLLSVPWELLFDPERSELLATERPVVRVLDLAARSRLLGRPAPIRVLVVLSSPADAAPLQTRQEWAALDQAFGGQVELHLVPPRLDEISQALRSGEWHVLHFMGHGQADARGGSLILEDWEGGARVVGHLQLQTLLAEQSLRLVVLNSCDGARTGSADAFSGVAQALLRKGVPAVVAMQQPISDRAAIAFARAFYGALAERSTVGNAMQKARKVLYGGEIEGEWAVPVLYLRGQDRPLMSRRSRPVVTRGWWEEHRKKILGAAAVLLVALSFLVWALSKRPETPSDPGPIPTPPRGASSNPPECPSPPGLDMAFVRIKRGTFQMGQKGGDRNDEPVHQVTITRPFCIGVYEVTQEQWDYIFENLPPEPAERYLPVQDVKYSAAEEFVRLINQRAPAPLYRLPTEAEWEYVARAGRSTVYSFGDDPAALVSHGNCLSGDGFDSRTWVGQLQANPLGVHDMYGNVFEWVSDWFGDYPSGAVDDPHGPKGKKRVRRGGSWTSSAKACSSAARSDVKPDRKNEGTGLRIVRDIR
jgi:formylglycine-generating enzyme required for sulfatase activity